MQSKYIMRGDEGNFFNTSIEKSQLDHEEKLLSVAVDSDSDSDIYEGVARIEEASGSEKAIYDDKKPQRDKSIHRYVMSGDEENFFDASNGNESDSEKAIRELKLELDEKNKIIKILTHGVIRVEEQRKLLENALKEAMLNLSVTSQALINSTTELFISDQLLEMTQSKLRLKEQELKAAQEQQLKQKEEQELKAAQEKQLKQKEEQAKENKLDGSPRVYGTTHPSVVLWLQPRRPQPEVSAPKPEQQKRTNGCSLL